MTGEQTGDMTGNRRLKAFAALLLAPMFFSTNVVFGRAATEIAPFTLAFIRWAATAAILALFCRASLPLMAGIWRRHWRLLIAEGFLGMFICGGLVYLALHSTTATNGTLIYTLPPVLILLVERVWRGRPLKAREMSGVIIAILGVAVIVTRGDAAALLRLEFNGGDLLFLLAAASWAVYSVILRSRAFAGLGTLALFTLVSFAGALTLLPAAAAEFAMGGAVPSTMRDWAIVAGIVVFSSLISFSLFQFGVKELGAPIAGIFMYLLPPFGTGFAVAFLDERFEPFHAAGIVVILAGIIIATFPVHLLAGKRKAGAGTAAGQDG